MFSYEGRKFFTIIMNTFYLRGRSIHILTLFKE